MICFFIIFTIMNSVNFTSKLESLPISIQHEIIKYVEGLLLKYGKRKKTISKFKFDWEGDLSDLKNKFTSVDLQHRINELR